MFSDGVCVLFLNFPPLTASLLFGPCKFIVLQLQYAFLLTAGAQEPPLSNTNEQSAANSNEAEHFHFFLSFN